MSTLFCMHCNEEKYAPTPDTELCGDCADAGHVGPGYPHECQKCNKEFFDVIDKIAGHSRAKEVAPDPSMKSFVTGSRAYGTPRVDSDIDLVCMVGSDDWETIIEAARDEIVITEGDPEYTSVSAVLRFGKLNLILVSDREDYNIWMEGTRELKARRPITRDEAKALFKERREALQRARDADEVITF